MPYSSSSKVVVCALFVVFLFLIFVSGSSVLRLKQAPSSSASVVLCLVHVASVVLGHVAGHMARTTMTALEG